VLGPLSGGPFSCARSSQTRVPRDAVRGAFSPLRRQLPGDRETCSATLSESYGVTFFYLVLSSCSHVPDIHLTLPREPMDKIQTRVLVYRRSVSVRARRTYGRVSECQSIKSILKRHFPRETYNESSGRTICSTDHFGQTYNQSPERMFNQSFPSCL